MYLPIRTKGLAKYFVNQSESLPADKKSVIEKLSQEFERKIFSKKITNMKLVLDNMLTVLKENNIKIPNENIIAQKAQLQFYSLVYETSKLSGKPINVLTIIKDLPKAVLQMLVHGRNPVPPMLPTVKFSVKNIEKAVGTSYQFSINKR